MTPDVDVAVIGGGPAGLAAAVSARRAGAERVALFERAERLGGVLPQCIHNGFGLHYFKEDLTGPEYAFRFVEQVKDYGIEVHLETMVLDLTPSRRIDVSNKNRGYTQFNAGAVVLAMGCRERTRGAIRIPGTRPAGVFTAGTAQRMVNIEGYLPGKEVVILGSGDIGMIMARRLTLEGAQVKAVVEILPYTSGLIRNEVQCLHDFSIPLLLSHSVTNIHGDHRVRAVTVSRVDENLQPVPGTERVIECDTLLLSVGLIPENELSRAAGVELNPLTRGPVVGEARDTSVSGIFACGNVLHVHDLVDNVTLEAQIAGSSAAVFAAGEKSSSRSKVHLRPGKNVRYVVPNTIDLDGPEEEAVIWLRISQPFADACITYAGKKRSFKRARPSEMITLKVKKELIHSDSIEINCESDQGNGGV